MIVLIFYVVSLLLLDLFSQTDLAISQAVFSPDIPVWDFFEAFGEWPLFILTTLSAVLLVRGTRLTRPLEPRQGIRLVYWGLTGLISAALTGTQPLYYLLRQFDLPLMPWITVGAVCAGLVYVLVFRIIKIPFTPAVQHLAGACVSYFWGSLVLINLLKLVWGRMRFRDLVDFEHFTAWYLPQGFTGHFSFPSAHVVHGAAILFITLLPRAIPRLRVKPVWLQSLAVLWLAGVTISRVASGAHYPSDVTASLLISVTLFLVLKKWYPLWSGLSDDRAVDLDGSILLSSKHKNRRLIDSVRNAWAGITTAVLHEKVFSIELAFAAAVTIASFAFRISRTEGATVIICCVLVLTTECVNSAIERIVDLVSPDYHPLARQIKDLAAGAVLITAIGSLVLGLAIFGPRVIALVLG